MEITIVGNTKFEGIPLHLLFSYTVSDKIEKLTSKTEIFTEVGYTLETYQLHLCFSQSNTGKFKNLTVIIHIQVY